MGFTEKNPVGFYGYKLPRHFVACRLDLDLIVLALSRLYWYDWRAKVLRTPGVLTHGTPSRHCRASPACHALQWSVDTVRF